MEEVCLKENVRGRDLAERAIVLDSRETRVLFCELEGILTLLHGTIRQDCRLLCVGGVATSPK